MVTMVSCISGTHGQICGSMKLGEDREVRIIIIKIRAINGSGFLRDLPGADESIVGSVIETGNGTGFGAETTMAPNRIMVGMMRCDVEQGSVLAAGLKIACKQKQVPDVVGSSGKQVEKAGMDRTMCHGKRQAVQSLVILGKPGTIRSQEWVGARRLDSNHPRFGVGFKCDLTSFSDWEHEARAEIIMNHIVIGPGLMPQFGSSGWMRGYRTENSTRRLPHYFSGKDMPATQCRPSGLTRTQKRRVQRLRTL
jgi:hypothetical protein